jgi:hypothetical protein
VIAGHYVNPVAEFLDAFRLEILQQFFEKRERCILGVGFVFHVFQTDTKDQVGMPVKQLAYPLCSMIVSILLYQFFIAQFRSFLSEYQ